MLKRKFIYAEESLNKNGWYPNANAFTKTRVKGYFKCLKRYGKVSLMTYNSEFDKVPFNGTVDKWLETDHLIFDFKDNDSDTIVNKRFYKMELNNNFYV